MLGNKQQIADFQKTILDYYSVHKRDLPWRIIDQTGHIDPYRILVSELMLQQTQVQRVIPKYNEFLRTFKTVHELAASDLAEVLTVWSGLGYNRRARFLWLSAKQIVAVHKGVMPATHTDLVALPGVGTNTAGAILVYAFNQPVVFIETNIRSVFLHHFYKDQVNISDDQLMPFIEASLVHSDPRQWYWALMDYGTHLKQSNANPSRASSHHTKQSRFEGSSRQIRGRVIKLLTSGPLALNELHTIIDDSRLQSVLDQLQREGLINNNGDHFALSK